MPKVGLRREVNASYLGGQSPRIFAKTFGVQLHSILLGEKKEPEKVSVFLLYVDTGDGNLV